MALILTDQDSNQVRVRYDMTMDTPWRIHEAFVEMFVVGKTARDLVELLVDSRSMILAASLVGIQDSIDFTSCLAGMYTLGALCRTYGREAAADVIACGGVKAILDLLSAFYYHPPLDQPYGRVDEGSAWLGARPMAINTLWAIMWHYGSTQLPCTIIAECDGLNLVWRCAERYKWLPFGAPEYKWLQVMVMRILGAMAQHDKLPVYTVKAYEDDHDEPQDLAAIADLAIAYIATDPAINYGVYSHFADDDGSIEEVHATEAALDILYALATRDCWRTTQTTRRPDMCWRSLRSPECQSALARIRRAPTEWAHVTAENIMQAILEIDEVSAVLFP